MRWKCIEVLCLLEIVSNQTTKCFHLSSGKYWYSWPYVWPTGSICVTVVRLGPWLLLISKHFYWVLPRSKENRLCELCKCTCASASFLHSVFHLDIARKPSVLRWLNRFPLKYYRSTYFKSRSPKLCIFVCFIEWKMSFFFFNSSSILQNPYAFFFHPYV